MAGHIGSFLLALGFSAGILSGVNYLRAIRKPSETSLNIARSGFYVMVFAVMFACAILMYLILNHRFEYHYVWAHSSMSLARPFLVAAFYSGQEGSFILWTLLTTLIGVFVLGYAQRYRYEAEAMSVYMFVIVLLLLILVVDSPFDTVFAAFPDQMLPADFVPKDGRGLNPQLENLWITIHPPILFTGFAAMTVPFVFAIAGLIRRDYQRWITVALPWTLFASMVLGFGIMLGGWWAYETLGWGGYWAWDPVENSSLIPWLICVALVHTMIVQKRTGVVQRGVTKKIGGLVRTNFVLAVCAFSGILYSTFLTRSGVLDDTSVHSFVTPGNFVYAVLLIILLTFFLAGLSALIFRWKDLSSQTLELKLMSRENWLGIGSAILLASAFVILVGTSWPILMPLIGKPKAKIDMSFYNNTHIWIGLAIVIINALSISLKWKNTSATELKKSLMLTVPIALVATLLVAVFGGVTDPIFTLLMFGALFALTINTIEAVRYLRANWRMAGAYVAHAGVAFLVVGVIFTSRYSVTEHVQLSEGDTKEVFGYQTSFVGRDTIEREKLDREKFEFKIKLEKDGSEQIVRPVIFWSDFNQRQQAFLEPGIVYNVTGDIYISPKSLEGIGGDPTVVLTKGEKTPVPQDSAIEVRFEKFDMSRAASEQLQGAVLEITRPDTSYYYTAYRQVDGRYGMNRLPGSDISVGFAELQADPEDLARSKARIRFASERVPSPPEKQAITLDVSVKPFISFVWGGVIIMVVGFFFSMLRRRKELEAVENLGTEAKPVVADQPESKERDSVS
ncbi:MAG: cytochrome c biogenesis protein CcsA [Ignavibacteriae bacterium]|nr:cytochrome c biogenesis protein CcsA [Ignavibacteriota bacterium]MCB9216926.1 cytochrome c biogenesis protein CcsA [Ignavibacteria bacterium]